MKSDDGLEYKSETEKIRRRLPDVINKYCVGKGIDVGFGFDKIKPDVIGCDLPTPYTHVGSYTKVDIPCDVIKIGVPVFDGTFDYVYSSHFIEDAPDTLFILKELFRICKDGGNIVLVFPDERKFRDWCAKTGQGLNAAHKHLDMGYNFMINCLNELTTYHGYVWETLFTSNCDIDYNVVIVLKLVSRLPSENLKGKKVLLQRLGAGGDIMMSEPIVTAFLKNGNTVHYLTTPYATNMWDFHPIKSKFKTVLHFEGPYDRIVDLNYEWSPNELAQSAMAKRVGFHNYSPERPKFYLSENEKINRHNKPYVIIHKEECRNLNYRQAHGIDWKIVVDYINKLGFDVLELGRNSSLKHGIDIQTTDWRDIASWIYNAKMYIGLDSGPSHLAASFNIPSILMFGSVNPKFRHVNFTNINILQNPCEFAGCYHDTKNSPTGEKCRIVKDGETPPCCTYVTKDLTDLISKIMNEQQLKLNNTEIDYTEKDVTFVMPSRNNLNYLKWGFEKLLEYYPTANFVLLSDSSTDGTVEYLKSIQNDRIQIYINDSNETYGIARMYNIGAKLTKTKIIFFFHADMYPSKNMVKNLLKYMKDENNVVCATRIEPPIHPPDKSKILMDFGNVPETFDSKAFSDFCEIKENEFKNVTTRGIFTPWMIHKTKFDSIGGHDWKLFKTYIEDSDIFLRFILNGYNVIQSHDSYVYHMTCRGSRFLGWDGKGVPTKSPESLFYESQGLKNHIRKWGHSVIHNEYLLPDYIEKVNIGMVIHNSTDIQLLSMCEIFSTTVYGDNKEIIDNYIDGESKSTLFPISNKVKHISEPKTNDVIVEFDQNKFSENLKYNTFVIQNINKIVSEINQCGIFEYGCFTLNIKSINNISKLNIINNDY